MFELRKPSTTQTKWIFLPLIPLSSSDTQVTCPKDFVCTISQGSKILHQV